MPYCGIARAKVTPGGSAGSYKLDACRGVAHRPAAAKRNLEPAPAAYIVHWQELAGPTARRQGSSRYDITKGRRYSTQTFVAQQSYSLRSCMQA